MFACLKCLLFSTYMQSSVLLGHMFRICGYVIACVIAYVTVWGAFLELHEMGVRWRYECSFDVLPPAWLLNYREGSEGVPFSGTPFVSLVVLRFWTCSTGSPLRRDLFSYSCKTLKTAVHTVWGALRVQSQ